MFWYESTVTTSQGKDLDIWTIYPLRYANILYWFENMSLTYYLSQVNGYLVF